MLTVLLDKSPTTITLDLNLTAHSSQQSFTPHFTLQHGFVGTPALSCATEDEEQAGESLVDGIFVS